MRFIAHRGNIDGPNPERENTPKYITEAIAKGYDVEIDVWKTSDLYLGHDCGTVKITENFLLTYKNKLWCHAKNIDALEYLIGLGMNTFWHQEDNYTITSHKYIWAYPGLIARGILVMPENKIDTDYIQENANNIKGICSDYIKQYRDYLQFTL